MTSRRGRLSRWLQTRALEGFAPGPYDTTVQRKLRVPMDDGVELLADLYSPVGEVSLPLPTIVIRSPYGRRPVRRPGLGACPRGLHRADPELPRHLGVGRAVHAAGRRAADGIATHRWVRKQPWCSGTVATFGPSYLGYTQWAVAGRLQRDDPENAPDALCLVTTMPDFGAITWDNGAFALRNALGWSQMMDRMRRRAMVPLLLSQLRPDPKLERAFDVLPLSDGDTAAAGAPIGWYQDWLSHERLTDDYWTSSRTPRRSPTSPRPST